MKSNKSLLILGHGSSKHPESSRSVRAHAREIEKRGKFSEVACAFLKEEPSLETAIAQLSNKDVTVVPDFLAEGYFTQEVIPEKLDQFSKEKNLSYESPVGTHSAMSQLLRQAAGQGKGEWREDEVTLLLVGHGSRKNAHSKDTLLKHMAILKQQTRYAHMADLWLEEAPFVSDWKSHVVTQKVLVLPYLLADGQHGGWDVPKLLGRNQDASSGYDLRLCPALGNSLDFAKVIEHLAG